MKKRSSIKLDNCEKIVEWDNFLGFSLSSDKKSSEQKKYSKVEDAIRAYLKKHQVKKGAILIYSSHCLNPQRGGWYNPDRITNYHRGVYLVTLDQLLHISDLGGKDTDVELYQVSSRKQLKKVSHKQLIHSWFETASPETKKEWLEKLLSELLFSEFLKNPLRFL